MQKGILENKISILNFGNQPSILPFRLGQTLSELKRCNTDAVAIEETVELPFSSNNICLVGVGLRFLQDIIADDQNENGRMLQEDLSEQAQQLYDIPQNFEKFQRWQSIYQSIKQSLDTLKHKQYFGSTEIMESLVDTCKNKPALIFGIVSFLRVKAIRFLRQNPDKYKYIQLGNQTDLLSCYSSQLRGLCLQLILDSIKYRANIKYSHTNQLLGSVHCKQHIDIKQQGSKWFVNAKIAGYRRCMDLSGENTGRISSEINQNQNVLPSRAYSRMAIPMGRLCALCGLQKTQRFCECRKNGARKRTVF